MIAARWKERDVDDQANKRTRPQVAASIDPLHRSPRLHQSHWRRRRERHVAIHELDETRARGHARCRAFKPHPATEVRRGGTQRTRSGLHVRHEQGQHQSRRRRDDAAHRIGGARRHNPGSDSPLGLRRQQNSTPGRDGRSRCGATSRSRSSGRTISGRLLPTRSPAKTTRASASGITRGGRFSTSRCTGRTACMGTRASASRRTACRSWPTYTAGTPTSSTTATPSSSSAPATRSAVRSGSTRSTSTRTTNQRAPSGTTTTRSASPA